MAKLNREQKDLAPLVEAWAADDEKVQQDLAGLEELLEDPEYRPLAQAEQAQAQQELARLEATLRTLLRPKDPMEGRERVSGDPRRGRGRGTAALFAADLYRMYAMYGEKQGWKWEVVSTNQTELGGFKELSCLIQGETGLHPPEA